MLSVWYKRSLTHTGRKACAHGELAFFSCHLWRHFRQVGCRDTRYQHTSRQRVFLSLSGWQIALWRCILDACIPRLLWRTLLSGFCGSFLISRDYSWNGNCTMGCFLWLCWERFWSSRHSAIGHRLGTCWSEFFANRPSSAWILLWFRRCSLENISLVFRLRHHRMNLSHPRKW